MFWSSGALGQESLTSCYQLLVMQSVLVMCGGSPTSAIRWLPNTQYLILVTKLLILVTKYLILQDCSPKRGLIFFLFAERRRHLPDPLLPHARHHRHPHLPPRALGNPSLGLLKHGKWYKSKGIIAIAMFLLLEAVWILHLWIVHPAHFSAIYFSSDRAILRHGTSGCVQAHLSSLQGFKHLPSRRVFPIIQFQRCFHFKLIGSLSVPPGAWLCQHLCPELCGALLQYGDY